MAKDANSKNSSTEKDKGPPLQILTDKQIEAYGIPKDQLWYLNFKGEPIGPYHRDDLRTFLEDNPQFPRDTKVANYVQQNWLPLFKVPEFQRRKPQMVPEQENFESREFYLLRHGQKV